MDYPNGVYMSFSSEVNGVFHSVERTVTDQINLKANNLNLQKENAWLRQRIFASFYKADRPTFTKEDSVYEQQYSYLPAEIINSRIGSSNNYFTINIGKNQGVKSGLGVISPRGILGEVYSTSDHYSLVKTVLTKNINTDVKVGENGAGGILKWGGDDPTSGTVFGLSIDFPIKIGMPVYTLGTTGTFPKGILIGFVSKKNRIEGQALWDIRIRFTEDYRTLQSVYVLKNRFVEEQLELELSKPKEIKD